MKKKKQNKPDGRRATCPRWDRWYIRIPTSEDQQKGLDLYRRSGTASKRDFVRAKLLGESFKVIVAPLSSSLLREAHENCYLDESDRRSLQRSRKSPQYLSFCRHYSTTAQQTRNLFSNSHQTATASIAIDRIV